VAPAVPVVCPVALLAVVAAIFFTAACSPSVDEKRLHGGGGSGTTSERLWNIAANWAKDAGANATDAAAVLTTERRAYRLLTGKTPDASDVTDASVWLVEVSGDQRFSCECGVRPGRDGSIDPRIMAIVVQPPSLTAVDGSWLFTDPLPLQRVGRGIDLRP
jgi:hypothetical protein